MIQQNISSNCFSMLKKKKKKPEEFGTRCLFLTIYFYFFISYQMHVLQVQRMSEVSINNLLPWFTNHAINDLCYCEVKSSPTTSKLLLAIVHFDCKLTFLRAEERLIASPVLQEGTNKLEQCFAKRMSSIICGKELSSRKNISSQLSGCNWQDSCPDLTSSSHTLRKPNPGGKHSGSVSIISSVILERLLSSEQLLLWKEEST